MNTSSRMKFLWFLAILGVTLFILAAVPYFNEIMLFKRPAKYKDSPELVSDLRRLAVELSETQRSLLISSVQYHRVGNHIEFLHNIIRALGGETIKQNKSSLARISSNSAPKKPEVCPETFVGKDLYYGFPLYRKGFERVNCTEFVPINKLVTVLVNLPEELLPKEQYQVFQGITKYYPNIPITLASKEKLSASINKKLTINLKNIVFKDMTHGETWSKLLREVTTPYVLFAPDMTHFTDDVNLERLVRVLSENEDTIIAGGSHKNHRGEWDKGCLQLMFRNWTAYFRGGYYHSFADCIVCDVLSGPFLAKTEGLKQVGIDEKLPFGVFQDLFWRLKLEHSEKVAVSCPDIMFNTYEREIPDHKYAALAKKWDVKKWVDSNGRVRWYGCRRGYNHTSTSHCSRNQGLAVPPCDLENLADMVKFVTKKCEETGVYCEIKDGTLLGAVKFSKVLPWEDDSDIHILSQNFTAYKNLLRPKLLAAGFTVEENWKPFCCKEGRLYNGSFSVKRDGWRIDMYGAYMMDSELLVASGQQPTRVQFAGQWVISPRNPGLYARNHYGSNLYRHAEHWRAAGLGSPWAFYKPSSFSKCPMPGHSTCLDQFPADGSEPAVYPLS